MFAVAFELSDRVTQPVLFAEAVNATELEDVYVFLIWLFTVEFDVREIELLT
jgi:hypothetical protein